MSESIPSKAASYVPACYIVIRSGYEVADAPYPCLPSKDRHPEDKLLINSGGDIPAVEDTATIEGENAVENGFQKLHETLSGISSQITSLAESQSRSEEQTLRMEKLCRENASQIKLLSESQLNIQQHLQRLGKHHNGQIQSLKDAQVANTEQLQRTLASNGEAVNDLACRVNDWHLSRAQSEAESKEDEYSVACMHNVHPPPRKIDRPILGYDYGTGAGLGRCRVDKAPGLLRC